MSIGILPEHRRIMKAIIESMLPNAKVLIFGSRAKGSARKYSDYDILIDNSKPLDITELTNLQEAFIESIIPVKVEIVDRHRIDEAFFVKIEKDLVEI